MLDDEDKEAHMEKTRLSKKGRIVFPKSIRMLYGWEAGNEFAIENTGDGIRLRPIKHCKETKIEDVIGCLGYKGPVKSLRDMESTIAKRAKGMREEYIK